MHKVMWRSGRTYAACVRKTSAVASTSTIDVAIIMSKNILCAVSHLNAAIYYVEC
jgi:hypothetical protein